jgi:prefoldin subunit 5
VDKARAELEKLRKAVEDHRKALRQAEEKLMEAAQKLGKITGDEVRIIVVKPGDIKHIEQELIIRRPDTTAAPRKPVPADPPVPGTPPTPPTPRFGGGDGEKRLNDLERRLQEVLRELESLRKEMKRTPRDSKDPERKPEELERRSRESNLEPFPLDDQVRGKVKVVEGDHVVLSIGSDDGLVKGHTLEVFRLGDSPKYLGTLKIVNVTASEAVGQLTGRTTQPLRVGDFAGARVRR